ncbi:MAG: type II toxin-antitoxin system HicA family toxin [Candidatus Altiarchaeales archaeon]|nr:type II toxin-antitoxin system HicA family toxin [Candidatus Altiarchaeales archaeon]
MSKLPALPARSVVKVLHEFGFKPVRQTGSHIHLWSEGQRKLVTVPNHRELARGTLLAILKQAGLARKVFIRGLRR